MKRDRRSTTRETDGQRNWYKESSQNISADYLEHLLINSSFLSYRSYSQKDGHF